MIKGIVTAALLLALMPVTTERIEEVTAIGEAIEEQDAFCPWTLAALAVKESRARLDVIGTRGECGPFQVMGWHLRPSMACEELQTPRGAVVGVVRALNQWRQWRAENEERLAWYARRVDYWHCYAAGKHCYAPDATRRLYQIRGELIDLGMIWGGGQTQNALRAPETNGEGRSGSGDATGRL